MQYGYKKKPSTPFDIFDFFYNFTSNSSDVMSDNSDDEMIGTDETISEV
jgi:hypothetical protein